MRLVTRAWLLVLVGCGGSPFALIDTVVDGTPAPDAATLPDASPLAPEAATVDAGPSHDAPADEAAPPAIEAGADVAPVLFEAGADVAAEAAPPEGSTPDAATVDAPAVCTPLASAVEYCGQSAKALDAPGQYCHSLNNQASGADTIAATPPECQCAGTYTCACIIAHLDPCPGQIATCVSPSPYVYFVCH